MALTLTYNTTLQTLSRIYTTTGGGTVFSANLNASTAFDYFADSAVVNDAIYFSYSGANISDISFTIGTAVVADAITFKWEYYKRSVGWTDIVDLVDDTSNFSLTGVHRVKFPLQWQPAVVTINGVSSLWIRCRISAVTNITEGGANITTTVKKSNGEVILTGTTDAVPATFEDIYTWMRTNYPYVNITKRTINSYDFTKICVNMQSRLYTTNEVIELGQDCVENAGVGSWYLYYLTSGIKSGTNNGYSGSTFIVHGSPNSSIFFSSYNTKIYGSTFKTGKTRNDANTFAGYLSLTGEWIDNTLEMATSMPVVGDIVINNRIRGALVIASTAIGTYTDNFYFCTAVAMFYVYRIGWTLTGFGYKMLTDASYLVYIYQGSDTVAPEWIFINPSVPLPLVGGTPAPLYLTYSSTAFDSVKFYDSSAGTYTDYTTQASSATADDVPLGGDVGDYYLFGTSLIGNSGYSASLIYTMTPQSNDYEYVYEYLRSGTWYAIDTNYQWDTTNNLTKSGGVYQAIPAASVPTLTTIDGVSSYWYRLRIVTKGTGSPKCSTIRKLNSGGVSKWSLKEKYSVDLKIVDMNGDPIDGATVLATDQNGTQIFSVNTDATGVIPQQLTLAKEWHFDPINNPVTTISENVYTVFNLYISKTGYETYTSMGIDLGAKINQTISLKPIVPIRNIDNGVVLATEPELGSSSLLVEV